MTENQEREYPVVSGKKPESSKEIPRRTFLKGMAGLTAALVLPPKNTIWEILKGLGEKGKTGASKTEESQENQTPSRKEHFKPFNEGFAEWQYVTFQFQNPQSEQIGVTVSMSVFVDPEIGEKTNQLLVMRHNLNSQETQIGVYSGERLFNETTSTYTFKDEKGESLVALSYHEEGDYYFLKVETNEFDSSEIDDRGLKLNPQGPLILVSKDGRFTVASFDGGQIETNYYADHIQVETTEGKIVGYGRRDSENLFLVGSPPQKLDIDHTWIHVSGQLADGRIAYLAAWESTTGRDYKFVEITIIDPQAGQAERYQFNEEDSGFDLQFIPRLKELEKPSGEKYQIAHGGKVSAQLNGKNLVELEIDGDPGQIIRGKGGFQMVEAQGRIVGGSILGFEIEGYSALWESTVEMYLSHLPLVTKATSQK